MSAASSPCPQRGDQGDDVVDDIVRDVFEFLSSAILDRVRHPGDRGLDAQRLHLRGGSRLESLRRNHASGDAAAIERRDVVQTARRARASVGKADDDYTAALDNSLHH